MAGEGDDIAIVKGAHAYFVFGRCNPPTIGHKRLIDNLIQIANEHHADAYVFVTSTQDKKKNPLHVHEKVEILKMMYPEPAVVRIINTTEKDCRTLPKVLAALRSVGYHELTLVAGSDRVEEFRGSFKGFNVISGGERDPDGDGVAAMSATAVRTAALSGNLDKFKEGINNSVTNAKKKNTFNTIRQRMGAKGGRRRRTKKLKKGRR